MRQFGLILILVFSKLLCLAQADSKTHFFGDSLILIETIELRYDSDQYQLNPTMTAEISDFLDKQNTSTLFFDIHAYTDSDGSSSYNVALSKRRSQAIYDFLFDALIPAKQIITHSYGESLIEVPEKDEIEKASNRRAVISIFQDLAYVIYEGEIKTTAEKKLEDVKLRVIDEGVTKQYELGDSTKFAIPVPINRKVEIQFLAKDHFPVIKRMKLNKNSKPQALDIEIKAMEMDSAIDMEVLFVGGQSDILTESLPELEAIWMTLESNPNVCVELKGHINYPNKPTVRRGTDNFDLSIARALEVAQFLGDQGISHNRLLARGYGNSQMRYPKAVHSSQERKNRRVEVQVISCNKARLIADDALSEERLAFFKRRPTLSLLNTLPVIMKPYNEATLEADLSELEAEEKYFILEELKYIESIGKKPSSKLKYSDLLKNGKRRAKKDEKN